MTSKYFLLTVKFESFDIGSIFQYKNKIIIDLDSTIEQKFDADIPKEWIEITFQEMKWLIKKYIAERYLCYKGGDFKKISDLKTGEKCYYRGINGDILSTIVKKIVNENETLFNVILQDGMAMNISLQDIQLCTKENENFKEIEDIMKLLLEFKGDIQKIDRNGRCVISMIYKLQNKIYFMMLLKSYSDLLDIEKKNIQDLLRDVVRGKSWDLLLLILAKCNIQENNNTFLPILAIEALKEDNHELLEIIFKFAPQLNKLQNGETFLTNLFKENISAETIIKIIKMKLFDLNEPNVNLETPLTLACQGLMEEMVKVLLENGADAHYNNFNSFMIINALLLQDATKGPVVTKIMELLTRFQPSDKEKNKVIIPVNTQPAQTKDDPLDLMGQNIQLLVVNKGNIILLNANNESVLTLSYNFPNKRLLNIFVQNYENKFDLMANITGQNLLTKIVRNKDMITLKTLLNKCILDDKYEVFLLNMALSTLKMKMKRHYKMIVKKCVNRNREIVAGETFLTNCFKEKIEGHLIYDILISDYFDINVSNASGQTPLMLACEILDCDLVKVLLDKGCDKSYKEYCALDIVVEKSKLADNPVTRRASKKLILDLMCGKMEKVKEKIEFTEHGFVDVTKVSLTEKLNHDIVIGNPVITSSIDSKGAQREYYGVVKCFGILNHESCAGIELDNAYSFGINEIKFENFNFICAPGHGVVSRVKDIKLNVEALQLHLVNNIVDPKKFIECEENWEHIFLKIKDIKKDDMVVVNHTSKDFKDNLKGKLRWFGTMNKVPVGIVELEGDHVNGTNGLFWKMQLINCNGERAIAVTAETISKFNPFQDKAIPINEKRFDQIDIHSCVIYYYPVNGVLKSLYGTVKWSGMNDCEEYFYGIELKKKFENGTDGNFYGQKLFQCPPGHGILVPVDRVAPDPTFNEKQEDIFKSELSEVVQYSIPFFIIRGKDCGIQGNRTSRFLDAILFGLFSKCDILDFMISPNVRNKDTNLITEKVRNILSWNIVYPLRKYGYVTFHHTKEMLEIIKEYRGNFETIIDKEIDLESAMNILRKLCTNEELLSLKEINNQTYQSMFLQLLRSQNPNTALISSQQALFSSMANSNTMFIKPPSLLVMQLPQDGKDNNYYKKCLPSQTINISNICLSYFRKCLKCKTVATYQCKKCIQTSNDIKDGLFCKRHMCDHRELIESYFEYHSNSDVFMELQAIICKDKGDFSTYVKEDYLKNEWVCFETKRNTNDYYDARVTFDVDISNFLNMSEEDMKRKDFYMKPVFQKIVENAIIYIYYNNALTCY